MDFPANTNLEDSQLHLVTYLTGAAPESINRSFEGTKSLAYLVNDGEWVVKFARSDDSREGLLREIVMLELLAKYPVPEGIQVPHLEWVCDGGDYLGYRGMVGPVYDPHSDTPSQQKRYGIAIGVFLRHVHSLQSDVVPIFDSAHTVGWLTRLFRQAEHDISDGIARDCTFNGVTPIKEEHDE